MPCLEEQIQGESAQYPDFSIDTKVIIAGQEYFKHQVHWYEDGSVGILVEDTAFFIHRGVVSRKSAVLKTLIDSSPPTHLDNGVPLYEQLHLNSTKEPPFIKLGSGDRAIAFARVLDFIYPEVLCSTPTTALATMEIMELVRFTHKYLIQDVKAWAVSTLESKHLVVKEDEWVTGDLERRYSRNPGFCVDVIQLSKECHLPQFLPLAFYALATMEWSDQPQTSVLSLDRLSTLDRWRVLQGRGALAEVVKRRGSDLYGNLLTKKQCPEDRQVCCDVWSEVVSNLHHWWASLQLHPLEELEFLLAKAENKAMCESCYTDLHMETREFRDELMRRLTEFFRLE